MEDAIGIGNIPEFTVGGLTHALKRTLEDEFGFVRVRGEISNFKHHSSGHVYLCLKDDRAKLEGVMWRPSVQALRFRPEDGLEVVCQGRITAYGARSQYQIVIERMEPAGAGALMALLEDRRRRLAAEGLFDAARKRPLPFLPEVIGIVTSPTGAVIRDIMHRLSDRFPRRVLLWPVAVQGESAADQIARAIAGFNAIVPGGAVSRPDLLIVARGGGSIEDLWPFNEEVVVRAAAASAIPLISAVGHETDTTLIDHAADLRAPTPTAAAELAVPVRTELMAQLRDLDGRRDRALARLVTERRRAFDDRVRMLDRMDILGPRRQSFDALADRLPRGLRANLQNHALQLGRAAGPLRPALVQNRARTAARELERLSQRLGLCVSRQAERRAARLKAAGQLIESYSYRKVLERGFAVVREAGGRPVTHAGAAAPGSAVALEFHDGTARATIDGAPISTPASGRQGGGGAKRRGRAGGDERQPVLL